MNEISVSAAEVIESNGTYSIGMQFVVTLSEASVTDIYIDYQTIGGTAIEGVDYVAASGVLRISAGDTSGVITVTTFGGTEVEPDEGFVLELTNPVGAVFAGEAISLQAQGVILDDDGTGNKLALLVGDAKIVEGDSGQQEAVFEVRLSRPATEEITLNYTTQDATATAGSDYEAATGEVTFLPGETVKAVAVEVNGDDIVEGSEQFSLIVTPTASIANGIEGSTGIATVLDDDAGESSLPVLSVAAAEVIESNGTYSIGMQFVVTLSEASVTDIYIDYQTIGGTATEGVDYVAASGVLRISAGDTSGVITITTYGGTEVELDEGFVLELTNPVGAVFAGEAISLQAQGVILDDDGTGNKLALLVGDAKIVEGDSGQQEAVFEVRLSRPATEEITLNYTTQDATATAGSDYEAATGEVTFLPGETVKAVAVAVNGDDTVEGSEQFSLIVTPTASMANGIKGSTGIATILDDDAGEGSLPVLSVAFAEVIESNGTYSIGMQFVVTLSEASATDVYIDYQTIGGTAIEGVDYVAGSGTFRILAGDTSGIITVTTFGGTEVETDEGFVLELTNPVGAVFAGDAVSLQAQGVILDDDGTGNKLALLVGDAKIVEGDSGQQEAVFEVRLSQSSDTDISIDYTTVSGSAQSGEDFAPTTGTLMFLAGQTVAAVQVAVFGDEAVEVSEQFSLVFSAPQGAEFGSGHSGTVVSATILDDDASVTQPVISLASTHVVEGNGTYGTNMEFVVTLSASSTEIVAVPYSTADGSAVAGSDYLTKGDILIFSPGQTSAVIPISIFGGTEEEVNESFFLELNVPLNAVLAGGVDILAANGTIIDNDAIESPDGLPVLSVSDIQVQEAPGGTSATFTLILFGPSVIEVSGNFAVEAGTATADEDFTPVSGSFSFDPGETSVTVTVAIAENMINEPTETIVLRLDSLSNARFSNDSDQLFAIGKILNYDNLAPEAMADSFAIDEDTTLTGDVLLDNGNGVDTDADGDALSVVAVEGVAAHVGQTFSLSSGALLKLNADGSFDYDSNGQFDGLVEGEVTTDSFEYTVSDGNGGQDTAQVSIEFSGINDAPVGNTDTFAAEENTTINGNVFADNGNGADFDPEGDAITASLSSPAANGDLTLNLDGSFVYTPIRAYHL